MPNYVRKALQLFGHKYGWNNMHNIYATRSFMEPRYNMQSRQKNHQRLMPKQRNLSNKFAVNFYS